MNRVNFRALGPLEISVDGRTRTPGGSTQRGLLAILLLNANRVVPVRQIIHELWEEPPETALGQIQTRVWRLRTLMNGSGDRADGSQIVTRPGGYMLLADPESLDFGRFGAAVETARALLSGGNVEAAARLLEEALALWRGPAFSDVEVAGVRAAAATLEELRMVAVEERVEADLALGRHRQLVPELQILVARHPLNERLRGQLMLALYRSDRQAEALETYRDGHRLLVAELGLEPKVQLQELHRAILTSAPHLDLAAPKAPVVPMARGGPGRRELPPDVAGFTGRAATVEALAGFLSGSPDGPALPVAAVTGRAGVGKTAFAVHVAHLLSERFPDGQFFVDLRGLDRRPAEPAAVLAQLLHRFGVRDGDIPEDPGERCALYRAHMAGRRVLLVLDNAGSEGQIRPLLPAGDGPAVIVTCRRRVGGLENARPFDLDVLAEEEAVELLQRTVGAERARDRAEAHRVVELCGRLPLAIRTAGARLGSRPHWSLARLADLLDDEHGRLDALVAGEIGVRASVALSYQGLGEPTARLFRLLGLLDAPTFAGWVAGPLLGTGDAFAEEQLEHLVEVRLIDVAGVEESGVVRYRIHDLLRLYARERAEEEPEEVVRPALERVFGRFLFLVERAQARLPGGLARLARGTAPRTPMPDLEVERLLADPLAWFESERQTLTSVTDQICARGLDATAWEICCCLSRFLEVRRHRDTWLDVNLHALETVRAAGNRFGEAHLLRSLGELYLDLDRYADAVRCLENAAGIFTELGEPRCAAHAWCGAALAHCRTGRLGTALRALRRVLAVFREHEDLAGAARALDTLGSVHRDLGRFDVALRCYDESGGLFQSLGDLVGGALVLRHRGALHVAMGRLAPARPLLERSLDLFRQCGDPIGEAAALADLGALYGACGEKHAAHAALSRALEIFVAVGDRYGRAMTLHHLGVRYGEEGEAARAKDCFDQAALLWEELGFALWEARTKQAREEL
ncbi:BTAD domain-containing putative transcriptional regulator [Microtetraspora fusca]|uniref:BTAD domain-containing putative transcriptional regulator n=1 Tax=Microtetraspora fusca TaxID=1997 RepID=A0ABW6VKL3_MICFU